MSEFTGEYHDLPPSKPGWSDVTDVIASDKRKKSFKVFQQGGDLQLLHVFSAGEYYGIEYLHVIHEDFKIPCIPIGSYKLMKKPDFEEKYGIIL